MFAMMARKCRGMTRMSSRTSESSLNPGRGLQNRELVAVESPWRAASSCREDDVHRAYVVCSRFRPLVPSVVDASVSVRYGCDRDRGCGERVEQKLHMKMATNPLIRFTSL